MHVERLTQLAEWLEGGAKHEYITFDMRTGITLTEVTRVRPKDIMKCKTSCCIAGYTVMKFNEPQKFLDEKTDSQFQDAVNFGSRKLHLDWSEISIEAYDLLELAYETGRRLFMPHLYSDQYELGDFNDPAWAARVIRKLIATGQVDWEGCRNAP